MLIKEARDKAKDWLFGKVHGNNLIYNTCWEDPRCDRALLEFDNDSDIVMITSAGCNALDYALDEPNSINCIDMNYRQNALLELKKAFFKNSNFEHLFQFFGEGVHDKPSFFYDTALRHHLPAYAQSFWDKKIDAYFTSNRIKPSFYFHGTSGTFARLFGFYMRARRSMYEKVQQLLEAPNLEIQKYWYDLVEPQVIGRFVKWAMKQQFTLNMLGIPRSQARLVEEEYPGGIVGFISDALRHIFTELPIRENYFWRLYINGQYTKECCPNYLKEENFESLKEQIHKVNTYTTTISQFLKDHPKAYSHYILLDHQDWLAAHDIPALEEEWHLILKNSRPGTKILLRSGAMRIDFFPDFVKERVVFEQEKTKEQHFEDRVGTYGSVYLGIVQ